MSDTVEKIQKIISKAGIDGTLTEAAVEYFNDTLIDNSKLKSDISMKTTQLKTRDRELKEVNAKYSSNLTLLNAWKTRATELKTREENMLKLELESKYDNMRVEDHKHMFELVFKNLEMRRNVFTPYAATPGDPGMGTAYPSPSGVQENEERTVTE